MVKFSRGLFIALALQGLFWMPMMESGMGFFKNPLKFTACKNCG